ncbi:MAG: putative lipid II flippase FtsW [bacterium]|nr:putative lipid II flippase FtsW [bacterium]
MNLRRTDLQLFGVTAALVLIGLLMVGSASQVLGAAHGDPSYYLTQQLWKLIPGLALMFLFWRLPYQKIARWTKPLLLLTFLMLGLVFTQNLGEEANSARRWLSLGFISFQPSELAKLFLILYLAQTLTRKRDRLSEFKHGLLPSLAVLVAAMGLVLIQPDLSTAVMLFITGYVIFWVAGVPTRHVLATLVVLIPLTVLAIYLEPYRWARITAFVDPWKVSNEEGYQAVQSLLAIGSGRLTGVGLGASQQKLFYLPEAHTDFIFSILAEELGLFGSLLVVSLFGLLVALGIRTAMRCSDPFGKLLATGITALFGVQAIVNIGVVTALLPTAGLPLPFVSYGGTSLIVSLAAMGVLAGVARQSAETVTVQAGGEAPVARRKMFFVRPSAPAHGPAYSVGKHRLSHAETFKGLGVYNPADRRRRSSTYRWRRWS